jgi:peptidoglycan/LPS O-acetylase OafA/YrhL
VTTVATLGHIAAGCRIALILFAVMTLLATHRPDGATLADRVRARGSVMLGLSILVYSPAHAAWLLGHSAPPLVSRWLDVIGTMLALGCLIALLAGRGLKRGLSPRRVRRGVYMNVAVALSIVGAAWLTR